MSGPNSPTVRTSRSWKVRGPIMVKAEAREYGFLAGYVITPHGIVGVYSQTRRERASPYTSMSFVVGGRDHERSWDRTFTDRYLKTLATRFAAEILQSDTP